MSVNPSITPAPSAADEAAAATAAEEASLLTDDTSPQESDAAAAATATAEGAGDEVTPGEAVGEEQSTPEAYADFQLPEGIEADAVALEKATPLFKELGLTQEQAQKLVDFEAERVQAGQRAQDEAFSQLIDGWKSQSLNDKEFGGEKFNENIALAHSALGKFGTPELKQLLEDHGMGNHPEMIRFMVKVGRLTAADRPGSASGPSTPQKDRVDILYPKSA